MATCSCGPCTGGRREQRPEDLWGFLDANLSSGSVRDWISKEKGKRVESDNTVHQPPPQTSNSTYMCTYITHLHQTYTQRGKKGRTYWEVFRPLRSCPQRKLWDLSPSTFSRAWLPTCSLHEALPCHNPIALGLANHVLEALNLWGQTTLFS